MSESLAAQIDSIKDPIGFAGLAKLVSCVDGDLLEAEKRAGKKGDVLEDDNHLVTQTKQSPSLKTGGQGTSSSLIPLFVVLIAGGFVSIAVSSKNFSTIRSPEAGTAGQGVSNPVAAPANTPAAQSNPAPTQFNWDTTVSTQTSPAASAPTTPTVPDNGSDSTVTQQPAAPSLFTETKRQRPIETKPRVATGAVLYSSEIQYCIAEKIRIEGGESVLNAYVAEEVDRFNSFVSDYNGRCGNFRYHRNVLDTARAAVEPFRDDYLAEGRQRFRKE